MIGRLTLGILEIKKVDFLPLDLYDLSIYTRLCIMLEIN